MSNHLAIAATSAALGRLLQDALDLDVPGAQVSHERPGGPGDDTRRGVNIFLFQVSPNASLRNADLPTRDPGGRLVARATAALDLHYLLTCYGNTAAFEPERILGSVVRRLHERPLLDSDLERIQSAYEQLRPASGTQCDGSARWLSLDIESVERAEDRRVLDVEHSGCPLLGVEGDDFVQGLGQLHDLLAEIAAR